MIKENLNSNIIKNNKIYNVKKAIKEINYFFRKNKINVGLFNTKVKFLISNKNTPAEIFCFKTVFNEIININYKIIFEETLIKNKKEIILWENLLNIPNINNSLEIKENILEDNQYIIMGCSDYWVENINILNNENILQYENSKTILFDRA